MKLVDAIAECERWLAYLEAQRQRSFELQKIASELRSGNIDGDEARRRKRAHDNSSVTVYDGAELAKAVAALIVEVRKNSS